MYSINLATGEATVLGTVGAGAMLLAGLALGDSPTPFVPPPLISITDVTQVEGNAGTTEFVFNVELSTSSSETITVNFTTVDGTATAADDDYETKAGTLTFNPGDTSTTIGVTVNGDTKFEPGDAFTVVLSAPTNAAFGDDTGTGIITNDDSQPTVSIDDPSATEGDPVIFTLTLSNPSDEVVTVPVNTSGNTATADIDYNNINNFVDVFFGPATPRRPLASRRSRI